jgi:hypothetical protein
LAQLLLPSADWDQPPGWLTQGIADFSIRSVTNNYHNNQRPTPILEIFAVQRSSPIKQNTHQQDIFKGISTPFPARSHSASSRFIPTTTILTLK